jgi:NifU-like protein involved in Fe-S cluster formation
MAGDLAALYQQQVRSWARKVRNDHRLARPVLTITRASPTCGSSLTLDLICADGRITEVGWRARACTLGMASTGVFVTVAPGMALEEILRVGLDLERLLDRHDVSFDDRWSDLEMFQAARSFPSRHSSILLPFAIAAEAARS